MRLKPSQPKDRLILALDVPTVTEAEAVVSETSGVVGAYKIGLELIYAGGIDLARRLTAQGETVFLDAKLLDIDNTVANAVRSILKSGAVMLTVHAYPKAIAAAAEAALGHDLMVLGVTVLTSMDDADLAEAGLVGPVGDLVASRAQKAIENGADGLVCSAQEVAELRNRLGSQVVLVTPGIRPSGSETGDQKRVTTPTDAIKAGADYLVVGRPILNADDRRAAAAAIVDEIAAAL
ncbi:orotidine-5'-phosphate decarboxylase [Amorphus orientalis]|uniref:Orotidine 5'-phosphate decarboxylase n=1 Tax=Amorphus orientalis TaxID=649198 RepID=A0AAE3VQV5_9HYPH|nr:orotidine-5'-phosphate decarboxylase [Amorphus orientalis]MDQ0316682.1 orotidine-5'-phosphate decarboxylase [Amorphus orientalis]